MRALLGVDWARWLVAGGMLVCSAPRGAGWQAILVVRLVDEGPAAGALRPPGRVVRLRAGRDPP